MLTCRLLLLLVTLLLTSTPVAAQPLPLGTPESEGFSPERLERLHAMLQRHVDEGKHSGLISLVARNGRIVDLQTYGSRDPYVCKSTMRPFRATRLMSPECLPSSTWRCSMACRRSSRSGENPSDSGVPRGNGWAATGVEVRSSVTRSNSSRQVSMAARFYQRLHPSPGP